MASPTGLELQGWHYHLAGIRGEVVSSLQGFANRYRPAIRIKE
jgi:hypothetical protein